MTLKRTIRSATPASLPGAKTIGQWRDRFGLHLPLRRRAGLAMATAFAALSLVSCRPTESKPEMPRYMQTVPIGRGETAAFPAAKWFVTPEEELIEFLETPLPPLTQCDPNSTLLDVVAKVTGRRAVWLPFDPNVSPRVGELLQYSVSGRPIRRTVGRVLVSAAANATHDFAVVHRVKQPEDELWFCAFVVTERHVIFMYVPVGVDDDELWRRLRKLRP